MMACAAAAAVAAAVAAAAAAAAAAAVAVASDIAEMWARLLSAGLSVDTPTVYVLEGFIGKPAVTTRRLHGLYCHCYTVKNPENAAQAGGASAQGSQVGCMCYFTNLAAHTVAGSIWLPTLLQDLPEGRWLCFKPVLCLHVPDVLAVPQYVSCLLVLTLHAGYLEMDAGNALLQLLALRSALGSRIIMTAPPTPAQRTVGQDVATAAAAAKSAAGGTLSAAGEAATAAAAAATAAAAAAVRKPDGEGWRVDEKGVRVYRTILHHTTFEEPTVTLAR